MLNIVAKDNVTPAVMPTLQGSTIDNKNNNNTYLGKRDTILSNPSLCKKDTN